MIGGTGHRTFHARRQVGNILVGYLISRVLLGAGGADGYESNHGARTLAFKDRYMAGRPITVRGGTRSKDVITLDPSEAGLRTRTIFGELARRLADE